MTWARMAVVQEKLRWSAMKRALLLSALIGATILVASNAPNALASGRKAPAAGGSAEVSEQSRPVYRTTQYRRKARRPIQVYVTKRGTRIGGYSYSVSDTFNTFPGDSRDPMLGLNRQTPAGPFDSGFFFDSPVAPRGGQSPYMQ
jgi:hypothetical protein